MKEYEKMYVNLNRESKRKGMSNNEMVVWLDEGKILTHTVEEALTYIERKYFEGSFPIIINTSRQ